MRSFLITLAIVLSAATPAIARPSPATSRLTVLNESRCLEAGPNQADEVGDELFKRCPIDGLPTVWLLYLDGVRLRLGFGATPTASGMFDADRDPAWPIEWRGRGAGRAFKPYAVILRLRAPGERPSHLVVFRLRADGTSCIVGSVAPGPNQNLAARALADGNGPCEAEPDFLGD